MSQTALIDEKILLARQMEAPEETIALGGEVVFFSTRSPAKTTENEDAAAILPTNANGGVLVVADGMGGAAAGEQASRIAIESIQAQLEQASEDELLLRGSILNAIENANANIRDLGIGAATTFAAVEIQDGIIRSYHIGDSNILIVGQRGKVKLQTVAHAPISMAVEAGVMDDHEAMHHEDRHLVSNALGMADMRIELGPPIRLSHFDTLLLASDGLFDNLHTWEIIEHIRKGPLQKSIASLVRHARSRMENELPGEPHKPDDLTVIGYRLRK